MNYFLTAPLALATSTFTAAALGAPPLMAQTSGQTAPAVAVPIQVKGAIKDAGIYHVATGTWTRAMGQVANFGPDTIYSNTAGSNYFTATGGAGGAAPMSLNFDEGSVPSSANSHFPLADRDAYSVNCFELGYCDFGAPVSGGWEISFYDSYTPCTFNALPNATFQVTGLPANGCWTVAVDLSGGNEFCLAAESGDGFDNVPELDSFGWSFRYAGSDGSQPAGLLAAGDPASTDPSWAPGGLPADGSGYYRTAGFPCSSGETTGLLTADSWWLEDPSGVASNCFTLGGYANMAACSLAARPYASFYLELQADSAPCVPGIPSASGCFSNPTSTGINSTIAFIGTTSISANALRMTASLPPGQFGFFITSQTPDFVPNPAGSLGNLCMGGNIGRFIAPGQIKNSGPDGVIALETTLGEWDVAAIPTATGPYTPVAGTTTLFQLWFRDIASIPTFNFSDAALITWGL
jgi:hypothetical protein